MKSILTDYDDFSVFSGKKAECNHHLIFGRFRELAEEDGLKIPLTNEEHNFGKLLERIHDNPAAEKLSKICGQLAFEKEFYKKEYYKIHETTEKDIARIEFRKRYGKSFL